MMLIGWNISLYYWQIWMNYLLKKVTYNSFMKSPYLFACWYNLVCRKKKTAIEMSLTLPEWASGMDIIIWTNFFIYKKGLGGKKQGKLFWNWFWNQHVQFLHTFCMSNSHFTSEILKMLKTSQNVPKTVVFHQEKLVLGFSILVFLAS